MTYFADLTPYRYFQVDEPALNVGWLGAGHEFRQGPVPEGFAAALADRVLTEAVNRARGWHVCDLPGCPLTGNVVHGPDGTEMTLGSAEIWPSGADGTTYAAPNLIHHYVTDHGYRPPDEFIAAVLGDTTMRH